MSIFLFWAWQMKWFENVANCEREFGHALSAKSPSLYVCRGILSKVQNGR